MKVLTLIMKYGVHLLILAWVVGCKGHSSSTPRVVFHFEEKFEGVFFVMKPHKDAVESTAHHQLHVPLNGVVEAGNFSVFTSWHQELVAGHSRDDEFILYNLGFDNEKIIYFYGSEKNYESKIRFVSPLHLKPGPLTDTTSNK